MQEINIDKIQVKDNIRKDYGDLTELTESIRQHGVRNPVELNNEKENELVDGHRRLKAAKAAGKTKVPYFYSDNTVDKTTEQIIAGIFAKNLNVVEEGKAYKTYIESMKWNVKDFAKSISKPEQYVQKRIVIATLPKEITDELSAGKIELGHALLLKKMPEQDAKKFLKEILRDKISVARAKDEMENHSNKISQAPFDKEACKGCRHNGSEQSELFETGKILNGVCLNKGCYTKKYQDHVKMLKEKYKDVLFKPKQDDRHYGYEEPKGYIRGDRTYDCKEHGITEAYKAKCREEKNYLVKISDSYGRLEVYEYFKPKAQKIEEKPEAQQAKQRTEVLGNRIEQFKITWLIGQCEKTIKPGTKEAKALTLLKMDSSQRVNLTFKMDEKEIDKRIAQCAIEELYSMDTKDLLLATSENGVDIKQFVITEEYLNLHTKDQLYDLIKELKIGPDKEDMQDMKKPEMVEFILKSDIKGKIPKNML